MKSAALHPRVVPAKFTPKILIHAPGATDGPKDAPFKTEIDETDDAADSNSARNWPLAAAIF